MSYASLSAMHRHVSGRLGPWPAVRFRRRGVWHDLSWSDYRRRVDLAAAGLMELGIEPQDRVAILSENRVEWLMADVAILACGAMDVPLHAPLAPPQVAYQLSHSGCRGLFISGGVQAAKLAAIGSELPELRFVVTFEPIEPSGSWRQLTWDGLVRLGQKTSPAGLRRVLAREERVGPQDLATIIYTSGTTGNPKGVMLSHGNLLSNAQAMCELADVRPDDVLLSWLPYSHIYARTVDHYLTTLSESTVCLAGSAETLLADLEVIQPTWMTSVPRFYEKVWALVAELAPAERARRLREIFGPRNRWLASGGAPLPPHIALGFREAGLALLEGYGLTESSPVISFNRLTQCRIGSVGRPIPGVEVRIAQDGEILTRGPHVMQGYWRDPDATSQTIQGGWLHTGDVGMIDGDGFLFITDRMKDLIITSGGKNVSPSEIERLLTSDPYIDQAVVYGDRRPFLVALLVPDLARLAEKARELGCDIEVENGFVVTAPLLEFLAERVERLMENVSRPERVRQFLILGRPLELAAGELTATMKIRRRQVVARFQDRLDALYSPLG